jgi:glycosyltransferase involved in cell wall biosynthesis
VRVLAISNLFPPAFVGGYELGASWICRELARRGHEVTVCSASRLLWAHVGHYQDTVCPPPADHAYIDAGTVAFGFDVPRLLAGGYTSAFDEARLAIHDALITAPAVNARLRDAVARCAPDVILVFNPAGLLTSPVHEALDACGGASRLVAYVSDDWPTRWPATHPLAPLAAIASGGGRAASGHDIALAGLAQLLASQDLFAFQRPLTPHAHVFCSDFLRRKCLPHMEGPVATAVAHWGLPGVAAMPPAPASGFDTSAPLTLAFCGQLLHHKGLAQLIRALPMTRQPHRLIVAGDATSDYAVFCKQLVETANLTDRVEFLGKLAPDAAVHALHTRAQALVVPSLVIPGQFEEPFSIVVLQGLALGMPVIASPTGGMPEAIEDGRTGRLCDVTDPAALAAAIDGLEQDRRATTEMSSRARRRALENYSIERMVDRLEPVLSGEETAPARRAASTGAAAAAPTVFMVATNASRDPANTGCVRVTRRLGRELQAMCDAAFVAWDLGGRRLRPLSSGEREVLSRFNGPLIDRAGGRVDAAAMVLAPHKLRGHWLLVPEVLPEAEFAAIRAFARLHGLQLAAIFYDAIPLRRPELCAEHMGAGHAAYMRGLSRCDLVLAISESAAADLQAFWKAQQLFAPRLAVCTLAGEVGTARPAADDSPAPDNVPTMLCVSTLEPRKGHLRLLGALDRLSRQHPELPWSMVLVGNRYAGAEDLASRVEDACARDSRIVWRGVVDDEELGRLYREASFTVYPSEIEGFGLPVAESLWFGRPCICANDGAVGELAREGGCLPIDVLDEQALADAMHALLADDARRGALASEASARSPRTWREYAAGVIDQLTPPGNASEQPARLTDRLYAGLLADHWQMNHAERLAFLRVIDELKPRCAIEIGTYRGGSLSALSRASDVVFSIDIDASVAERFADFHNVRFLTGSSQALLPELLNELQRQDLDPEFVLVDGSHTADDVRADLSALLKLRPRRPVVIIAHDSANPECRRGMLGVDWQSGPYVSAVELDFVPGSAQTALTKPLDQLWGGLALIRLEPEPRTGPLVISSGAMRL